MTLVAEVLGAQPGPRLVRLAVRAGGNPLYVRELVDVLAREGRLRIEPGVSAEVDARGGMPVPTSLRAAIAGRIVSMSQETQRVLQSAALLGPEFSVTDLATVRGKPAAGLTDALMEAHRSMSWWNRDPHRIPAPDDQAGAVRGHPGRAAGRLAPAGRAGARPRRSAGRAGRRAAGSRPPA